MAIRIPPKNILDKILKLLGKERAVVSYEGIDEIYK